MDNYVAPQLAILCWEYGHVPKGLLQLESLIGNSTNLGTYPFNVRICRIKGANIHSVLENPKESVLEEMIRSSRELVKEGIKVITTSCGFNAIFQKELSNAVDVPVYTSSLLQVPFIYNVLPKDKIIGVITAKKSALKSEHLASVGINNSMKIKIFGMESSNEWNKFLVKPEEVIDLKRISKDVIDVAVNATQEFPNIAAFVLECTDLPPFSQQIREATGLPVYDFQTMLSNIARSIGLVSWY